MRYIFKTDNYEILSLEDLRYETSFDRIYNEKEKNTHLPVFDVNENTYVKMGEELRQFFFIKSTYAFRYYDNGGVVSPRWTAIFCKLEGEPKDCVILSRFAQSSSDDSFDNLNPYGDIPTGRWSFWSEYPRIFFKERDGKNPFKPSMQRVWIRSDMTRWDENLNTCILGYAYDSESMAEVHRPVTIEEYYIDRKRCHIVSKQLEQKKVFLMRHEFYMWCKENGIDI